MRFRHFIYLAIALLIGGSFDVEAFPPVPPSTYTGDVLGVGDCTDGACLDGSSDGGTYVYLYDGVSAYVKITGGVRAFTLAGSAANSENLVLTLGNNDNTLTFTSDTGANSINLSAFSISSNGLVPDTAGGADLGSTALEWDNLYLHDNGVIYGQADQSNRLTSQSSNWHMNLDLIIAGGDLWLISATAGAKITGGDGTLTFTGAGSGTDENLSLDLNTDNLITFSTTTGATLAFTPSVAFNGDVTIGALTGQPQLTAGVVSVGTQTKSFTINQPTASDDFLLFRTPYAITITAIHGVLQSGTNVVGGLDYTDSDGSSNLVAVDADITFDGGLDSDDGSLSNPTVAAGKWVKWHTTSVSAPGYLTVTIYFE